jgi:hypothetical protein
MKVTVTRLALKRLGFLVLSAALTAVLSWATQEYESAVFFPVIYWVLTTLRDLTDKSIPNK